MPGPVPKRDDERIRRNKTGEDGLAIEKFVMDEPVQIPHAVFNDPEVQGMWNALKKSVNVKFYEPTDWAYAIHVFTRWDKALAKGEPGAMMMSALDTMLKQLVFTEGERRRLKIEAVRGAEEQEPATVSSIYEKMLTERPSKSA